MRPFVISASESVQEKTCFSHMQKQDPVQFCDKNGVTGAYSELAIPYFLNLILQILQPSSVIVQVSLYHTRLLATKPGFLMTWL